MFDLDFMFEEIKIKQTQNSRIQVSKESNDNNNNNIKKQTIINKTKKERTSFW